MEGVYHTTHTGKLVLTQTQLGQRQHTHMDISLLQEYQEKWRIDRGMDCSNKIAYIEGTSPTVINQGFRSFFAVAPEKLPLIYQNRPVWIHGKLGSHMFHERFPAFEPNRGELKFLEAWEGC